MRYISTRGSTAPLRFQDAVITGLAPDGGLLLPEKIPNVASELGSLRGLTFPALAKALLPKFIDDIPVPDLDDLVDEAYAGFHRASVVRLRPVGAVDVLELFHGPTLAFKDIALQLLGRLFAYILERRNAHLNILGATSGDTGSAAIASVCGQPRIDIFVMYPNGRVSRLQELQMTTVADANVHCLAINGSFDDCQTLMKSVFGDLAFKKRHALGAVNSVNWARVLAQIIYYAYASLRMTAPQDSPTDGLSMRTSSGDAPGDSAAEGSHSVAKPTDLDEPINAITSPGPAAFDRLLPPPSFCVPTGNFGNVFAGYVAKHMGFPIDRLIVATNENDILAEFFASGRYRRGEVRFTVSPAMDIQVASNFERFLYYHLDADAEALKAFMTNFQATGEAKLPAPPGDDVFLATTVNTEDTLSAIREAHRQTGYTADPHTAVGLAAASRLALPGPVIVLATAHPAKFPESVDGATGLAASHPALEALKGRPERKTLLPANLNSVKAYIEAHAGRAFSRGARGDTPRMKEPSAGEREGTPLA